jgi:hypothetical protein
MILRINKEHTNSSRNEDSLDNQYQFNPLSSTSQQVATNAFSVEVRLDDDVNNQIP